MPYRSCAELNAIHAENLKELNGGILTNFGHRGSSTDMGDVGQLLPALHAYCAGFTGSPHAKDFVVTAPEKAYIDGAKLLAMDAVTLLADGAEKGKAIAALPAPMDKESYFKYKELFNSEESWDYTK